MSDLAPNEHRLEVHVLSTSDATLAAALAVAGLRPTGWIGTAELWIAASGEDAEEGR